MAGWGHDFPLGQKSGQRAAVRRLVSIEASIVNGAQRMMIKYKYFWTFVLIIILGMLAAFLIPTGDPVPARASVGKLP